MSIDCILRRTEAFMSSQPYYFVRTRRWKRHNLREVAHALCNFNYVRQIGILDQVDLSDPQHDYSPELEFKADTLHALISARRAVLFQKTLQPFTQKDLQLREIIFNLYPDYRLPLFIREPSFEIQ